MKLIAYILVFVVVLIGAIASKLFYLLMIGFVSDGQRIQYCDVQRKWNAIVNTCHNRFEKYTEYQFYSRSGSSIVCNSIRWFSRGMDLAFVYIIYCSRSGYTFACGTNMFLPKHTEMFVVGIGIGMNYESRKIISFLRTLSFAPVSCGRLSCCMCWA